jgi:hypothetical protein
MSNQDADRKPTESRIRIWIRNDSADGFRIRPLDKILLCHLGKNTVFRKYCTIDAVSHTAESIMIGLL